MAKNKIQTYEIKRIMKKDIIINDDIIMRPLQNEKDTDIEELSKSFDSNGMINEIDVRISKKHKGKYELVAGARRLVATKGDSVLAKIFSDMSDLKAMCMSLTENNQRKNPSTIETDAFTYRTWKKGKQDGEFETIQDLSDSVGMGMTYLGMIIAAGELKENDSNIVVQNATTINIHNTKNLSEHPDLRYDLLKKEQDDKIITGDVEKIAEEIKRELDTGTEKETVKKVLEIIDNVGGQKNVVKTVENTNNTIKTSKAMETGETLKISDSKFTDILDTYKKSPSDIKDKLEKREIGVGEAKLLNQFDTKARRDKVLNDLKIAEELHDWDKKKTVDTRLKQQEDLNNKGETDLKTRQDRELEEELRKERNKDQTHDQRCLDRYQRMSSYILETVSGFSPKALRTDEVKTKAAKIFRGNYELFHSILVALGDIREIIPENIKRQKAIGTSNIIVDTDIIDAVVIESKEE